MSKREKKLKKKMNFISTFLIKRHKMKKKKAFFNAKIGQDQYELFLKEVDKAIFDLIKNIPDQDLFLDQMGKETAHWLKDIPLINLTSFKAGACFGVFAFCRMKKELTPSKEKYVV